LIFFVSVKPAVFDFFLALAIGGYLGMIYLFVLVRLPALFTPVPP